MARVQTLFNIKEYETVFMIKGLKRIYFYLNEETKFIQYLKFIDFNDSQFNFGDEWTDIKLRVKAEFIEFERGEIITQLSIH